MENEEVMKEANEAILKRWRDYGMLNGLKEGSQMEWRCAKSFELMSEYLINNGLGESIESVYMFPILRRSICSNRPRLNRIIKPEEIFEFWNTSTFGDAVKYVYSKSKKNSQTRECFMNYLEYRELNDKKFPDVAEYCENNEETKMFNAVLKIDIIAELVAIFSQYVNYKLADKN